MKNEQNEEGSLVGTSIQNPTVDKLIEALLDFHSDSPVEIDNRIRDEKDNIIIWYHPEEKRLIIG